MTQKEFIEKTPKEWEGVRMKVKTCNYPAEVISLTFELSSSGEKVIVLNLAELKDVFN